jgi:hypothetical protein
MMATYIGLHLLFSRPTPAFGRLLLFHTRADSLFRVNCKVILVFYYVYTLECQGKETPNVKVIPGPS